MLRAAISMALLFASACAPEPSCTDALEPYVVTGLSGVLDDGRPAVEIQLRAPANCALVDTTWMFWNEETDTVTLEEPPSSGTLDREMVEAGDDLIAFTELNLGVRLDYPDGLLGPEVTLAWFSSGMDIAHVDCAGSEDALACEVREP